MFLFNIFLRYKYSVVEVDHMSLKLIQRNFHILKDRVDISDPNIHILHDMKVSAIMQETKRWKYDRKRKYSEVGLSPESPPCVPFIYTIRRCFRSIVKNLMEKSWHYPGDRSYVGVIRKMFPDTWISDLERFRMCYFFGNPPHGNNHDPRPVFAGLL